MSHTTPLLSRKPSETIAWLIDGLPELGLPPGKVDTRTFLQHVNSLAKALPAGMHVVNLCTNRYFFLVALCAAITREQTSLLPPNKRPTAQADLAKDYPNTYLIHDGVAELADIAEFNVRTHDWNLDSSKLSVPHINDDFLALISFTSGSTGKSKPNFKRFRTLTTSTAINCRYMLPENDVTYYHLATVPGQHMWGLETSVLMAMFAQVCLVDSQPFYPADITDHLAKLPEQRCLISTPLHLRALIGSSSESLKLANVLCATAPLAKELAAQIEEQFSTELREVYGCSEVGSMAVRRSAATELWQPFDGLEFSTCDDQTAVNAKHLPSSVILEDQLIFDLDGKFSLQGRQSDQIKIAGKRGSLQEVNRVLLNFSGLADGVVFLPEQTANVPRLAALVVFKGHGDPKALRQHLKKHLDSAFIPRRIIAVEALPREENGKLSKQQVLNLYEERQASRTPHASA